MSTELKIKALTETKKDLNKTKNQASNKDNTFQKNDNNVLYSKKGKVYILIDRQINVVL